MRKETRIFCIGLHTEMGQTGARKWFQELKQEQERDIKTFL